MLPARMAIAAQSMAAICAVAAAIAVITARKQILRGHKRLPTKYRPLTRVPLPLLPRLRNDLLLRAMRGEPTDRVPVWCMRQAGRHLPEFCALRDAGFDFFMMCRIPEVAVEVSLQPWRRYKTDAVIIFSDILVVPQAMGMVVEMQPKVGPVLPHPLRDAADVAALDLTPDIEKKLGYVLDAINLARQEVNGHVPIIGFVGAPLTLLCYMVEGGGSRTKAKLKTFLYESPKLAHKLLQALTDVCVGFLIAQQQAGAQALQVFETVAAKEVTQDHFFEFCLPYLDQIATRVKDAAPETPLVCFSMGTPYAYERLADTAYDCLSLDWQSDPAQVRREVDGRVALQGNLDPCVLLASKATIRDEVRKMLTAFGTQKYVANLGHGCMPEMDPERVDMFVKSVQQLSLAMNDA